jgi:hypothetical protein
LFSLFASLQLNAATLFVEAESFQEKGGWVVDQQFIDLMGSSYLMAHGLGRPVADAVTEVTFPEKGIYYVYVRTYNWTSPWTDKEGAGKFLFSVGGKKLSVVLGNTGSEWMWQEAGKINIKGVKTQIALHDLTGFNGRCDAIYFTTEKEGVPPSAMNELEIFRRNALGLPSVAPSGGNYDFVVVGAGIAGMCAAISAARLGCKVVLINDRPVLGGNNSSEVRVHLAGRIDVAPYEELGNLLKEFAPTRGGNAQPAGYYEDEKKLAAILAEENITLFTNFRAMAVDMDGDKIRSVLVRHIENGEELTVSAPLFSDCTGDGTIGYLAGADFLMGRESRDQYHESMAPEQPDKMTMGASVQWYSVKEEKPVPFPPFNYGIAFAEENCEKTSMGEWNWETGMYLDPIKDFERIRDYGMFVIFSNWSFLKNDLKENQPYKNSKLDWVAYIAGKRESRRLLGDYVVKEQDLTGHLLQEDGTATATRAIDLHYPDPENTKYFPGNEFKAVAEYTLIYGYPIPYRCFYSRNIDNLFMAGRNISVTHISLGSVRVMRTTGMMGEVVGMAASVCKKYNVNPRKVYHNHLDELKSLMKEGVGKKGLPDNQRYNEGRTLTEKPVIKINTERERE